MPGETPVYTTPEKWFACLLVDALQTTCSDHQRAVCVWESGEPQAPVTGVQMHMQCAMVDSSTCHGQGEVISRLCQHLSALGLRRVNRPEHHNSVQDRHGPGHQVTTYLPLRNRLTVRCTGFVTTPARVANSTQAWSGMGLPRPAQRS